MLVASLFAFQSCNKDDDAPTDATVTITVIKDGKTQSGVQVYVFRQGRSTYLPTNADMSVITDASGVASVDLENVQGQENISFGVFFWVRHKCDLHRSIVSHNQGWRNQVINNQR